MLSVRTLTTKDMTFKQANLNPTGKRASDCVVRSIMYAVGQPWQITYLGLCDMGAKLYDMPNSKRVYEKYLESIGWKKHKMPRFPDNTRYTVREFANENPKGTYILKLANHVTVVKDGELVDSWDCSYKSVGNYWTK